MAVKDDVRCKLTYLSMWKRQFQNCNCLSKIRNFIIYLYYILVAKLCRRGVKWRDIIHYKQCTLSLTNLPYFSMPWRSYHISVHFCSPIPGFFLFYLFFSNFLGAKINFVLKGIQICFEMAEKQVYKQTDRHVCNYNSRI